MSQAIATTARPALARSAVSRPVNGCRGSGGSLSTRQSSRGSGESGFATTTGSSPAEPTVPTIRASIGRPPISTSGFGSPIRRLAPPARTAPTVTARFTYPVSQPLLHRGSPPAGSLAAVPRSSELIEIDDARRMVLERAAALGPEPVAVREALGRVLAEPIVSEEPIPGFDNSAMDGYAVRSADLAEASADSPTALAIVGESRAGHPAAEEVTPGSAIVISTGAMVPAGADSVVRVEDSDGAQTGVVNVTAAVPVGNNIRRAGEDAVAGAEVLAAGTDLGPAEIGVLASVGRARVACGRRPRVAVLTTGDELQEPGEPLRPGAVRNSNLHALAALVEAAGAELAFADLVADTPEATRTALERALSSDVTIVSGGVSVGPHDHVRPALAELGVEQVFWGVALRPGKADVLRRRATDAGHGSLARARLRPPWEPGLGAGHLPPLRTARRSE